ncbi:MAG: response regulator [Desulfobacterales bacterium]|uniref:histidine kinase n=1 Tax=Candidatus Desulfatibia profunda TaxID=2841695 RepID=A0A8J6NQE3_9BACT|nr:response regulator [Candidatus Desulfatibia profunda]MBL7180086.1 response regulator [Desulfobacterales bacterium]
MDGKPAYNELEQRAGELEKKVVENQAKGKSTGGYLEAMEFMGMLIGAIVHDINNLLMGIQGNTSLMLLGIDAVHPFYEKLKNIEQYIQNGADLTERLLGFARKGKYEAKPTDLNPIIARSSEIFARMEHNISIHPKYQKDIWTVEVDQGQIEQVFLNFYINACQAMPDGGELYLQTENVTLDEAYANQHGLEPGGYVKISVTDTGAGMDEATSKNIFEPLFSARASDLGIGLGLAPAHDIVKNHGGIITVYSEKGKGTTFSVYLPVSEKVFIKEEEFAEELSKGSETVLLVDDEQMIIDVGSQLLEKLGYKVYSAESGKAALKIYKENKDDIDIVILDVIMPGMNGGETYDRLKALNVDVKVLLSSGYGVNRQINEILARGCNEFIQKPFNMKQLSRKIRKILDDK